MTEIENKTKKIPEKRKRECSDNAIKHISKHLSFEHTLKIILLICSGILPPLYPLHAQAFLTNVQGRNFTSLNGKWQIIIDPFDAGAGSWKPVWKDQKPSGKFDFYEYGFNDAVSLNVPGDWSSQQAELKYYEGTVWYKKTFIHQQKKDKRDFLYFGAVNYLCDVYFNNEKLGSHEGGFTPFQFEVTGKIKDGNNSIILRVSNQRKPDDIPALNFDWWNYGGITRDVYLVETPLNLIRDYFIQLKKSSTDKIDGWIQLDSSSGVQKVSVQIPALKINYNTFTNTTGKALISIDTKPILWSPENPVLYEVIIRSETDSIHEAIGFRNIEVNGEDILLNGKPVFLRGVNIHEEVPQRAGRAWSESDAQMLLGWAKELGCNFVRLTHYPHNEHTVRLAEKMGMMLWEEIPLWQNIQFTNPAILNKADTMLNEMITRDKNRCAIIMWSLSNETAPSESRNNVLAAMADYARSLDSTRLITSAFNHVKYEGNKVIIDDSLSNTLDVIGVNEYLGWYVPWKVKPEEMEWENPFHKPLIMSEFGGEALYGNHGAADTNSSWSEERQEQLYHEQITMLKRIPFLRGTCPWVLADFRSPGRLNPRYQQGWNRKGLLSDKGLKKKAWFVMNNYYKQLEQQ